MEFTEDHLWDQEKIVEGFTEDSYDGRYLGKIDSAAKTIQANKDKYMRVAEKTNVPWQLIWAIHYREASFNFKTALHNGDEIIGNGRKTYRVPKWRGPFSTWEEAAIDAINMKWGMGTSEVSTKEHLAKSAAYAETYNWHGYRNKGKVSPYVWWGTEYYGGGRYVADHKYDPNSWDQRPGVMPILFRMTNLAEKSDSQETDESTT